MVYQLYSRSSAEILDFAVKILISKKLSEYWYRLIEKDVVEYNI